MSKDKLILLKRKAVYEAAKAINPNRWSGHTRAWQRESEVIPIAENKVR